MTRYDRLFLTTFKEGRKEHLYGVRQIEIRSLKKSGYIRTEPVGDGRITIRLTNKGREIRDMERALEAISGRRSRCGWYWKG
jgi:hypothetical protein